jgi:hypothetical protein
MTDTLKIAATNTSPEINFEKGSGVLEISGSSRPENIFGFYDPVIEWLREYAKSPSAKTTFNFKLHYFNSASAKIIHGIVNLLTTIHKAGADISINWYYADGDDESLESGNDYASLSPVPFNFVKVSTM